MTAARYVKGPSGFVELGGGAASSFGPSGQFNYTASTAGNANQAEASKISTPGALIVDRIGIYIGASAGNICLGVYDDDAGVPGDLLATTGSVASPGTGPRLFPISELEIPAGDYWLAMVADGVVFSCGYWSSVQRFDPATDTLLGTTTRGRSLAAAFPLPDPWVGGSAMAVPRTLWVEHS